MKIEPCVLCGEEPRVLASDGEDIPTHVVCCGIEATVEAWNRVMGAARLAEKARGWVQYIAETTECHCGGTGKDCAQCASRTWLRAHEELSR